LFIAFPILHYSSTPILPKNDNDINNPLQGETQSRALRTRILYSSLIWEESVMEDLKDYSGDVREVVRFEDLSKDALVRLAKAYCKIYLGYMGIWDTLLKEKMSADEVAMLNLEAYLRSARYFEAPRVMEAMNIQGNDVVTLIKLLQMIPDGSREDTYLTDYDIKNNNLAIMTIKVCPTLLYWERKGDQKSIEHVCSLGGLEELSIVEYARCVNPDIKIVPLKLPPRKSKDDIACQWKLKLGEE